MESEVDLLVKDLDPETQEKIKLRVKILEDGLNKNIQKVKVAEEKFSEFEAHIKHVSDVHTINLEKLQAEILARDDNINTLQSKLQDTELEHKKLLFKLDDKTAAMKVSSITPQVPPSLTQLCPSKYNGYQRDSYKTFLKDFVKYADFSGWTETTQCKAFPLS